MEQKFPLIKINNLAKRYTLGGTVVNALDSINLEINRGEFISILGKSGSGKSTLMHLIGLLDKPTSGEIFYDGICVNDMSDSDLARLRGQKIGFIFQSFNLLGRTSAIENVLLPATYSKKSSIKDAKTNAITLLKRVDLLDRLKNTPAQLSGGQQQRVAIARALINDPDIILADEPTGNLDSKSGKDVLKILEELHNEGKTVVIVTHDQAISSVTKRTIRISDGKIVEDKLND